MIHINSADGDGGEKDDGDKDDRVSYTHMVMMEDDEAQTSFEAQLQNVAF